MEYALNHVTRMIFIIFQKTVPKNVLIIVENWECIILKMKKNVEVNVKKMVNLIIMIKILYVMKNVKKFLESHFLLK